MPARPQGRLLALALRCYSRPWLARHGDEARELAALLADDGVPVRSMAWSYFKGAARERLTRTRTARRLGAGVATLVTATSLAAVSLLVSMSPAQAGAAGVVHGAGVCTQRLLLPPHFSGHMVVLVGRAAKTGENYVGTAVVFRLATGPRG